MAKVDPFTQRRLIKFIEDFRQKSGQLPTLKDFADQGISEKTVDSAVHEKILESLYVTLTNGTIVKGYKVSQK